MEEYTFTDKELHCLARTLQNYERGDHPETDESCLYCKYALECLDECQKTGAVTEGFKVLNKIRGITNVCIIESPSGPMWAGHLLSGSWVEKYPELYKQLICLNREELTERLTSRDIMNQIQIGIKHQSG